MVRTVVAGLGVLLLLGVSACGSGGSASKQPQLSAEGKKVAANIAASFVGDSSGAMTKKQADCFATAFVDQVGVAKLKSAKLIDDSDKLTTAGARFDPELSGEFADAFLGCVDYLKLQSQQIADADSSMDAEALRSCLQDVMSQDYLKKLIVASQNPTKDGDKLVAQSNKLLSTCKTKATTKAK